METMEIGESLVPEQRTDHAHHYQWASASSDIDHHRDAVCTECWHGIQPDEREFDVVDGKVVRRTVG